MIHVDKDFSNPNNWYLMKVAKNHKKSDRCILTNDKINNQYVEIVSVLIIRI